MMALWVTNATLDNELIYTVTKALWSKGPNNDKKSGAEVLAEIHDQGKNITLPDGPSAV